MCSKEQCSNNRYCRGLCRTHYQELRAIERGETCSVEGCDKPSLAKTYCNAHYCRYRNHGDPLGGNRGPVVRRAVDHSDGTRECTACGNRKPLDQYDRDKSASKGHRSQCKTCRGAKVAAWYQANHDVQLERHRAAFLRDNEQIRLNDMDRYRRHRSKRIALATDNYHKRRSRIARHPGAKIITDTGLRKFLGDRCCYCDVVMVFERIPGTQYNPIRATIEHITPLSKGGAHDWHNCVLACRQCNMRKNNMNIEEFVNRLGPRALGALAQAVIRQSSPHPEPQP